MANPTAAGGSLNPWIAAYRAVPVQTVAADDIVTFFDVSTGGWQFVTRSDLATELGGHTIVMQLSDFPTPSGGVITLADDTAYLISGAVDIGTNRIVCGTRNVLKGTDRSNDKIISTTTGALITCDSSSTVKTIVTLDTLTLQCTTGSLFDLTGTASNTQNLVVVNCTILGFVTLGTLAACNAIVMRNSTIAGPITTGGFAITGTGPAASFFVLRDCSFRGCAGTMFAFGTSVWGEIQIDRSIITTAASETFLSGTTGGANVTVAGTIGNNIFTGAGTYISTLTNADTNWSWTDNVGVTNTKFPTSALVLPGGSTNFLREDGTWQPAGGGSGTVTTVSVVTANGAEVTAY